MKYYGITITMVSLLSGCVSQETVPMITGEITPINFNVPVVGEEATATMGSSMMKRAYGYERECLTTKALKSTPMTALITYTIPTGDYCSTGIGANYFSSVITSAATVPSSTYGLTATFAKIDKDAGAITLCPYGMKPCIDYGIDEYSTKKEFHYSETELQQTIEYMGRQGNTLDFVYAEFKGGIARQAFNRSFKINLDQGNVLNYKGAIVEVIEAGNASITYVIKKYFE